MADGIVSIIKPPGMTSHDVVSAVRRILSEKKAGHCGTLDPQAAGVLPVCLGAATRLADYITNDSKRYYCEMKLGAETDTQDAWGKKTAEYPVGELSLEEIRRAALGLTGLCLQEVPVYSAVKVGGQALYKKARQGLEETGLYRQIRVHRLDIIEFHQEKIRFHVHCGKGTYVRTLCRDLGRALGTGGYMTFLLRTGTGPFHLGNSVTLEELAEEGQALLWPKELAVASLPGILPEEEAVLRIRQGQSLWLPASVYRPAEELEIMKFEPESILQPERLPEPEKAAGSLEFPGEGSRACVLDGSGRLAAIGSWSPGWGTREGQGLFKPLKVFPAKEFQP